MSDRNAEQEKSEASSEDFFSLFISGGINYYKFFTSVFLPENKRVISKASDQKKLG